MCEVHSCPHISPETALEQPASLFICSVTRLSRSPGNQETLGSGGRDTPHYD